MFAEGMLAIWSDVAPQSETDYLHWLTREHAAERVSTTGFLSVRVFRAMDFDIRRYFIVYDLENASALSGADYVHKLNHPTSWSQRIMPTLKNFVRGGGRVTTASGAGHGGFAGAVALDDMQIADAQTLVQKLADDGPHLQRARAQRRHGKDVDCRHARKACAARTNPSPICLSSMGWMRWRCGRRWTRSSPSTSDAAALPPFVYKQVYQLDRRQLAGV